MMDNNTNTYQLTIELFHGMACPGLPVSEEITIEVKLSDDEVAKIRQLVKDYDGDKDAGLMPILESDAEELYERIDDAAKREIFHFHIVECYKEACFDVDEDLQRQYFKHDLENGVFNPAEFIDDSIWYDEIPEDEEDLFYLWVEWERATLGLDNVMRLIERYPDLLNQLTPSDDPNYICRIPSDFMEHE